MNYSSGKSNKCVFCVLPTEFETEKKLSKLTYESNPKAEV